MKQKLFLVAAAVLALSSCSNDETVEINSGKAIGFRTSVNSRAQEITNANLSSFFVTAYNDNKIDAPYFADLEFKKTEGSALFYSDVKYYFPGDLSSLDFYAYAPSKDKFGTATLTITSSEQKLTDFEPAADFGSQIDFITATATANKNDVALNEYTGVELAFSHRLSQIEIKGVSENTSYDFEVQGVRIAKAASKGSFNFADGSWEVGTEKAVYEKNLDAAVVLGEEAASLTGGDCAMLIPQTIEPWAVSEQTNDSEGAYLSVLLKVTTKDGALVYPFADNNEEYAWAAIPLPDATVWEAGKKYIYTLNYTTGAGYVDPAAKDHSGLPILVGEIRFDVTVDDWTESSSEIEMPAIKDENMDPDGNEGEDPFGDL